jgi:AcrR family transcriptional regulator
MRAVAATREGRHERARAEILAAGAGLLSAHGVHGLSMRDLARATGHSLANFYHYFSSKDDLVFEVQSRAFETLIATAAEAVRGTDPPEARLHAFVYNHVRYVAAHRDVMRVLVQEAGALTPLRRRLVRELKERYFRQGLDIVRAVVEEGGEAELERATYSLFGMLNWVYGWYDEARHGTAADVARTIHSLALGGLVGHAADPRSQAAMERRVAAVELVPPLQPALRGESG